MKILHVYKDYDPILGGIENHMKWLAEAQAAAGHEVTVLVTNPAKLPKYEQQGGVFIIRAWRLATVASTPLSPEMPFKLPQIQADIVHLHSPYPVGEMSQLLRGGKRPYVITYHSDVVKQQTVLRFYRPFLKRVLDRAAQIIVSNDNYIHSSEYLRPLAAKCTVIPFAVDVARFQTAIPSLPPTDVPTFIFVGAHRYYKGVDDLLRAMVDVNGRCLIGGDGPRRAEWEALAHELHITGKVQFLGKIPDEELPRFFAAGDVFVLPSNSRAESFGIVLQEAMAAGRPCVTTELGTGTSWLVQDGVSGLVVPPQNPEALAAALNRLAADADLRGRMGKAGQQRAAAEFTMERMLSRIDTVYLQALEK
ncbi:MAG: glycosyltransferase [Chloroflexi bacterium]|nr:glycosyltransferase [Chloroflexota bacterium]